MTPVRRLIAVTCCVFVAFASATWLTPSATAVENEAFGLAPEPERVNGITRSTTFSIPLEPGAIFEDAVRVYNKSSQTLDLAIYAADAEATLNDEITVGFRTSDPKGVGSWIDLSRDDAQLPPRDEIVVTFRVEVKNAEPKPNLGAIVVENTGAGLAGDAAQRLHLVVRTNGPNTETTSARVRPLVLRSPWIIVAIAGLVVAAALVWIGARRARHPKDVVVPAGELEQPEQDAEVAPEASRPVIKRLGASEPRRSRATTAILERSSTRSRTDDERPLLDDALLVEVEPDDDDQPPSVEGDDEEDEEDPLPPARHREPRARASDERAPQTDTRQHAPRAETRQRQPQPDLPKRKPAARRTAKTDTSRESRSPKRKPAAKRSAATRTAGTPNARKTTSKKNFIPLDDL